MKVTKFWKDIVYTNGKLDEAKVAAELSDYHHLLKEVPKVYEEVTGGQMSKTSYYAKDVIAEFHEHYEDKEITRDDVESMIEDCADLEELKAELLSYFEID